MMDRGNVNWDYGTFKSFVDPSPHRPLSHHLQRNSFAPFVFLPRCCCIRCSCKHRPPTCLAVPSSPSLAKMRRSPSQSARRRRLWQATVTTALCEASEPAAGARKSTPAHKPRVLRAGRRPSRSLPAPAGGERACRRVAV